MPGKRFSKAANLSDADLLHRAVLLAGEEREATVELVAHLAEIDTRKLYLSEGYGSLFAYCTGALRLAEHAAYNRIEAARLSRRFPEVLDLLSAGSLNLTTARLLAPHLRPDNFEEVVAQARGKSRREVEALAARLAPRPDVPASVRRLPARSGAGPEPARSGPEGETAISPTFRPSTSGEDGGPTTAANAAPTETPVLSPSTAAIASSPEAMPRGPSVTALAPERYRLQFTIGGATHEKLRQIQDLLRREIPDGDPGAIFDRALSLLLESVAREKLALTPKPRPTRAGRGRSRQIPAAVKRAVWLRDAGRCAFVSAKGRRCSERAFLEFHHCEPYAVGGEATAENISLRCRAHNVYEAELAFGKESAPAREESPAS